MMSYIVYGYGLVIGLGTGLGQVTFVAQRQPHRQRSSFNTLVRVTAKRCTGRSTLDCALVLVVTSM